MHKKIGLAVAVLILVSLVYLAVKGSATQEIRTEIEIAAPPEKVWAVLSDVAKWQEWSPIINKSVGSAELGNTLEITMLGKEEGQDGPVYSPEVIKFEAPKIFQWRAHMMAGFIMTNDKVFELEKTGSGTKLIHKELFSGMLAPIFCGKMEEGVPPMLNAMNKALKKLVENP